MAIGTLDLLVGCLPALALNPSLEISQYAHTKWTVRDGAVKGNIYAMAQTPDGYLWLGTEFGLFRFDGVRMIPWPPPSGQRLPDNNINSLLVTRDGTLWIGTFAGLVTWRDGTLTRRPEVGDQFVASLYEDPAGKVWVSTLSLNGRLCALDTGAAQCYGEDGSFGRAVWALYQDSSGTLWAGAESGLWQVKPGPPRRFATGTELIGLNTSDDGRLLMAMHGGGLGQLVDNRVVPYPVRAAGRSKSLLGDNEIDSNRLLRDRDGGLWIGTVARGLIHVHRGRTDVFTQSNGLSGDIVLSVFEDREGNVWVATTGGLDRFRELPVTTITVKQGLSSDATASVLAAADGSIWLGAVSGLTRYQNGQFTVFRKASGLPDDQVQSLFQDDRGRIWVFTRHGLAYFTAGRFVAGHTVPSGEVYSITGDKAGHVWFSGNRGLSHMLEERLVEHFPWSQLGRREQAKVVVSDQGGVWLGFWRDGGVSYFKDGQLRASYAPADRLGEGHVPGLQLDREGALWAATQDGGLSRIKDGRVDTLTSRNGLPCNTIHWSIEDDDRSFWLYTVCGLVRITRTELDAWIADPKRRIATTVWDAADGVRLRSSAVSEYAPAVTKSIDGKLWFVTGEGVQVVDPRHLAANVLPPPVRIERIIADQTLHWDNVTGVAVSNLRLPPRIRDLQIEYTALSLVAPEKIRFKYRLDGQDDDWREVAGDRHVQYSNLGPGTYRFRVIASNNDGVWNEQGDTVEFSVAPAYYQTTWFRAVCAAGVLALLWGAHRFRIWRLQQQFDLTLEARVGERTRIARELHDTLLQSAHGVLLRFETASQLLPQRPSEAKETLDSAIAQTARFITEARDEVQGLRESTVQGNDLALAISTLGEELATGSPDPRPAFRVAVEGETRDLHPILRDEIYKIAGEALRNAFRHARARRVEVEIRYDNEQLRLRVRDDGRGIDAAVLAAQGSDGHFGLPGMSERATLIGGKLAVWSDNNAGTELELRVPASAAYAASRRHHWLSRKSPLGRGPEGGARS
jgi:signal transduction histidine kinase/ligand-binding sensor domain-containing protein